MNVFKAKMYCSICKERLPDDLDNTMWYWGYDLEKHPLILAHKLTGCDPGSSNGWGFSQDFGDYTFKAIVGCKTENF